MWHKHPHLPIEASLSGELRYSENIPANGKGTRSYKVGELVHMWNLHRPDCRFGKVQRLILECCDGYGPEGYVACHRNDIPSDNRFSNLYWGSKSDNMQDAYRNGYVHNRIGAFPGQETRTRMSKSQSDRAIRESGEGKVRTFGRQMPVFTEEK